MPTDSKDLSVNRRSILKAAGVAGAAGLAGCTGGGGGGDGGGGGGGGGDGDGGGGGGDGDGGGGKPLSDVSFEYWNIINIQTRNARDTSEAIVKEYQDKTGATVKTNFSSYTDLAGAKWINRFKAENYPSIYDSETFLSGHLVDGGWVLPASEYVDKFENQDLVDKTEYVWNEISQRAWRGFEGNGLERVFEFPFVVDVRQPNIRLKSHFEEAGLSTEYGPLYSDLDDLIAKSQILQEKGPADITLPVFGQPHDWSDVTLVIWNVIAGGADGLYLNEDWSEPNFLKDIWKTNYEKYVNIHLELGLSSPKTPTLPDEDSVPEIIAGNWSQSWADPWNHGGFIRQAPDMMKNGEIYYNPHWEGPGGNGLPFGVEGCGITKPPEGADENTWSRKQDAAVGLAEYWLSESVQSRMFNGIGGPPILKDLWPDVERSDHRLMDYFSDTLGHERTKFSVGAHPQMSRIYSTTNAPFSQSVLKGSTNWEEALQQMYDKTLSNLGRWAK